MKGKGQQKMKEFDARSNRNHLWKRGYQGICVLFLFFLLCLASGCRKETVKGTGDEQASAGFSLRVPMVIRTEQTDFPMVQEAFTTLVREKLGIPAELVFVDTALKSNVVRMYRKEHQGFDLINSQLIGDGMYRESELLPLDSLLEEYGSGIRSIYAGDGLGEAGKGTDTLWVPAREDTAECICVLMRRDLLEETGMQVRDQMSWEETENIFKAVEMRHPKMKIVAPEGLHLNFLYRYSEWVNLAGSAFVAMDYGRSTQAQLLYETDTYRKLVTMFYRWNQNGWIPENIGPVPSASLVCSGELFSYLVHYKPGIEFQEGIPCGAEMQAVRISQPFQRRAKQNFSRGWAITGDCSHPQEAMKLLNLLYTDADVMNLLMYGIEGIHYNLDEQGCIVISRESGYAPGIGWALPNQYLCYRQAGEPEDLWEEIRRNNEEAICGAAVGFSFRKDGFEEQLDQLRQIVDVYADGLARGVLDPEIYLPEFLDQLRQAGSEEVLEAVQQQYDKWLRDKGKIS